MVRANERRGRERRGGQGRTKKKEKLTLKTTNEITQITFKK